MLFDLRGRGRRRTIQGIYLFLALLMGGGLIFFGVGGTGVGLFNTNNNGSGGNGNIQEKQVKAAERQVRLTPKDPAAWASLARARYQNASFSDQTQTFTKKGLAELQAATQAWDRYLALNPKKPDASLARLMANAFDPTVLNRPTEAVRAWEIVIEQDPSRTAYQNLAVSAYLAGQTRKGDLAAQAAVQRTPKDQRQQLQSQLKSAKKAAAQARKQGAGGAGAGGASGSPSEGGGAGQQPGLPSGPSPGR